MYILYTWNQTTLVLNGVWAFFWRVLSPQNRGHSQPRCILKIPLKNEIFSGFLFFWGEGWPYNIYIYVYIHGWLEISTKRCFFGLLAPNPTRNLVTHQRRQVTVEANVTNVQTFYRSPCLARTLAQRRKVFWVWSQRGQKRKGLEMCL